MSGSADTIAALLACAAVVAVLFALSSVTHLRSAGRTARAALLAFGLAALAVAVDNGVQLPLRSLATFLAAVGGGAALAMLVPFAARISQVGWISGLAAGAVALTSLSRFSSSQGLATLLPLLSATLGFAAMVVALLRLLDKRDTPAASVAVAISLSLAGAAQVVAGLWASQALLLITGGVVACSGVALARAMAKAAGRPLAHLLLRGPQAANAFGYNNIRQSDPEGAAMILATSNNVVIVPGYGLALAQGQHGVKELVERMEKAGARVRIVIHPAAGIVPGHMNALLDEAGIPHSKLIESGDAAAAIKGADVLVVGANDVVNSDASRAAGTLLGLDAVDLASAQSVWVIKRSLAHGQGEVRNNLFELPQTTMILGDAKKVLQALVANFNAAGH